MGINIQLDGITEQIQDHIADNFTAGGYIVGTNFLAENAMQYTDIARLLGSEILLTIFDEGGTLSPSGRRTHQNRLFRFVTKGNHANQALDRARNLFEFLWNETRHFTTTDFSVWVRPPTRFPTVIDRSDSGSFLADIIVPMLLLSRRG